MPEHTDHRLTPDEIARCVEAIPLDRVAPAIAALAARLLTAPKPEPEPEPTLERHLSPEEIADRLGTQREWVYSRAEQLGAVKLGRRTMRVPESNLMEYLKSCRVAELHEQGHEALPKIKRLPSD